MIAKLRHIGIAAAMLLGFAGGAAAQTPQFYIGAHAGKTLALSDLSDTAGNFDLNGAGMNGYIAGVHTGFDLQLKGSPVFFGVLAGYDFQNTEFSLNAGSMNFQANLNNSWYAGGRAGFVIWGAKVYTLAAYRQAEWDSTVKELTSPTLRGYDLGLGVEVPVAKNVSFGVEGINTHFQKAEFEFNNVPTGVQQELQQLSIMARLNFTLGGNPVGIFDDRQDPPHAKGGDPKIMGKP